MTKWDIQREFIHIRERLDAIQDDLTSREANEGVELVSKAMTAVEEAQKSCDEGLED